MDNIFFRLLKNIYKVQRLPIKRFSWEIEMRVLDLNIELGNILEKYDKVKFENKNIKPKNNR
jgi:hypothetical protein